MNIPYAIEKAFITLLRNVGVWPEELTIRGWQSLDNDASWDEQVDRSLPMIEVRCAPPSVDEDQVTFTSTCAITIGTRTVDDKSHGIISDLYEQVQDALDNLFIEDRNGVSGEYYSTFASSLSVDAPNIILAGITIGEGQTPQEDQGVNIIGLQFSIHYSRGDY